MARRRRGGCRRSPPVPSRCVRARRWPGGCHRTTAQAGMRVEAADVMDGHQFEEYYASVLVNQRWRDVRVVGRKAGGDGGADILATDPDRRPVAIQCKRWALTKTVGIDEVRKLNGTLAK